MNANEEMLAGYADPHASYPILMLILMLFNLNTYYADTDADIKMFLCFFQCLLQKTATYKNPHGCLPILTLE